MSVAILESHPVGGWGRSWELGTAREGECLMLFGPFSPTSEGEIPKHVPMGNESLWWHLVLVALLWWFSAGTNSVLLEDVCQCPSTFLLSLFFFFFLRGWRHATGI